MLLKSSLCHWQVAHLAQHSRGVGAAGYTLAQRSFLGGLLPESLLYVLHTSGPGAWAAAMAGDSDTPELVWTHRMRGQRLVPQARHSWHIKLAARHICNDEPSNCNVSAQHTSSKCMGSSCRNSSSFHEVQNWRVCVCNQNDICIVWTCRCCGTSATSPAGSRSTRTRCTSTRLRRRSATLSWRTR